MIQIPLTQGKVALVDDEDAPLAAFRWCAFRSGKHRWYAMRTVKGRTVLMHRVILQTDMEVDHANGDGLDNRRENLRPATRQGQCRNSRPREGGKSVFRGVCFDGTRKKPWIATCRTGGRRLQRWFATEAEAVAQYDAWVLAHHGAFARPNNGPVPAPYTLTQL